MKDHSATKGSGTLCETAPPEKLTVLSISPIDEDHLSLDAILGPSTFALSQARDLMSALALLQKHDIAVVLCERDLLPGTWIDVLEHIKALPIPSSLIVTSRIADERLWAEALNLGAWDVLASNPFVSVEVIRTVESAWRRWKNQLQIPAADLGMLATAS